MAGINRLGKAPPKPGTLRPPDPNKYRTVDMFSEGAEGDMDYIKTVRDIEEMQQQQGWLFGRGAFDKADLLYLRDTMEQQRHMELELRDNERSQFASLRAQLDKGNDDHRTTGSTAAPRSAKRDREPTIKVQPKVKPVVVAKKGHEKAAERAAPPAAQPQQHSAAGSGDKRRKVEQEEPTQQPQQEPHSAPDSTARPNTSTSSQQSDEGGGLEGLLGGYGSDSDASDDGGDSAPGGGGLHAGGGLHVGGGGVGRAAAAVSLPSATELLDSSKPMDSTLPKPQVVDERLIWTLPEAEPSASE